MKNLIVSDVRKGLPALIDKVAASGEGIIITRRGKPVAKLVPCDEAATEANPYPLRGIPIRIPEDFDQPMPGLWGALGG